MCHVVLTAIGWKCRAGRHLLVGVHGGGGTLLLVGRGAWRVGSAAAHPCVGCLPPRRSTRSAAFNRRTVTAIGDRPDRQGDVAAVALLLPSVETTTLLTAVKVERALRSLTVLTTSFIFKC